MSSEKVGLVPNTWRAFGDYGKSLPEITFPFALRMPRILYHQKEIFSSNVCSEGLKCSCPGKGDSSLKLTLWHMGTIDFLKAAYSLKLVVGYNFIQKRDKGS